MEYLTAGRKFTYVQGYRANSCLRDSFNALTRTIFGFDFEQWYQDGYWQESYIPCSLVYDGTVVANASVNLMDFEVWGERKRYIQVGTVMTDPAFRNLGLSRVLMEKILETWGETCDLLYLFANDSVRGFYPKFGFTVAGEYQCAKAITCTSANVTARKVDMSENRNRQMLVEKVENAKPAADMAMIGNSGLVMFYCTAFMRDNVYYIEQYNAFAIAEMTDSTLHLYDLFCDTNVSLDIIIANMATDSINSVVLGFTPRDKTEFTENLLEEKNTTLFLMGKDARQFQNSRVMFPILSRA